MVGFYLRNIEKKTEKLEICCVIMLMNCCSFSNQVGHVHVSSCMSGCLCFVYIQAPS